MERRSGKALEQSVALAEPASISRETYVLGTSVTARGAVPVNARGESFFRGGEVFVSVNVGGAKTDHVVEVKWISPAGEVIRRDLKGAAGGTDHVAFSSGPTRRWIPGPYRAVILIDGRSVSQKAFTVL